MNGHDKAAIALPPPHFLGKWYALVLSAILLLSLLGYERYESYKKTESHEMARLQTLARVTDANLVLHLTAIDRLLLNIRDKQGVLSVDSAGAPRAIPSIDELRFFVETTPGTRTLAITDDKGNFLVSNRSELVGKNFADRPYFRAAQKVRDSKTLVVSEPVLTSLNAWGLQLARPIIGGSGEFLGAVVVTLDPEFFKSMLSSVLYADDLRCLLMHQNGVVFQAVGDFRPQLGSNLAQPGSLLMSHRARGENESALIQTSYSTGDKRIAVLRNVGLEGMDNHFVITFSRSLDEVYSTWRRESWLGGLGFLVVLFSSAAWLLIYQRQQVAAYHNNQELLREKATAEEARQRTSREIEELYNNAPCGYHSLDADGTIQHINQTELDWLGLKREDVEGKLKFTELLDDAGLELFRKNYPSFMETGFVKDLEFNLRRHDGTTFTVLVTATAAHDEHGRYVGSRTTLTDITERKAAEMELERHRDHLEELVGERTRALAEAKERAESANRAKSLFLGNMSHEMRTPVHQISGVAGLLKNSSLTDKQHHYLDLLNTAVSRLNTVIGGILTLVDLESGSKSVKLAPINPNKLIQDVVAMVSDRATQKGLQIDFVESRLPEHLLGDAGNIETIAACYCNNAITFSQRGNIQVRLASISEDAGSALVRLEVKDEGIGIAPENCERLFEHFEQADNSHTRAYGGTGVGLAIVKKLARLMGGDAGCESTLGVGSIFWATFVMAKGVNDSAAFPGVQDDYAI